MKHLNKILLLLLVFIISTGSTESLSTMSLPMKTEIGVWVQTGTWNRTNNECNYGCTDLWYSLWYFSEKDKHNNITYAYVFQSNSKWKNGHLSNTVISDINIYVDGILVSKWDYSIIIGTTQQGQQTLTFKVPSYMIKNNTRISFYIKKMESC